MAIGGKLWEAWRWFIRRPLQLFLEVGLRLLPRLRYFLGARYQYQQLTSLNQLRVVRICPPITLLPEEPIRCSLETVSLDDFSSDYTEWAKDIDPNLHSRQHIKKWQLHVNRKEKDPKNFLTRFRWGDYTAISYTWGPTQTSDSIILDGHCFPVPRSVVLALRSIRTSFPKAAKLCAFWLDYLCINQQDSSDKATQVMRMQKIFGESLMVFIHLGESSEDSDLAIDLLNRITWTAGQAFNHKEYFRIAVGQQANGTPFPEKAAFLAVLKLFNRPYWHRLWIIQELVMGDDLSIILCGNNMTTLSGARLAMKLIVENMVALFTLIGNVEAGNENPLGNIRNSTGLLWWVEQLRHHERLWQRSGTFVYSELRSPALSLAQTAMATYRYDKIFGMLGILPRQIAVTMEHLVAELPSMLEKMTSSQISDDKKREIEDEFVVRVFVTFVKAVIAATNDLDIIFARNTLQKEQSLLDLPSWVTDWTLSPDRSGLNTSHEWHFQIDEEVMDFLGKTEQNVLLSSDEYRGLTDDGRADAGRKSQIRFSSDNKFLCCQGLCIGTVESVSPEPCPEGTSQPVEVFQKELNAQTRNTTSPYGNDEETALALVRTLLFDGLNEVSPSSQILSIPWFGEEASEDAASGQFEWSEKSDKIASDLMGIGWDAAFLTGPFALFELMRRRIGNFELGGKLFKDYFPPEVTPDLKRPTDDIINIAIANLPNRRLTVTSTGHFALAPLVSKRGDQIFVILGCSCPVLLRPCETHEGFEVVGECYVEGFMKGEAVKDQEAGNQEFQEICLC